MQVQTFFDPKNILSSFKSLSDPLRLRVIGLLRSQELCFCKLRKQLDVSSSTLSFHLKQLKEDNLIRSHQKGCCIYYSLNISQFIVLEEYLAQYWRFSPIIPIISTKKCED